LKYFYTTTFQKLGIWKVVVYLQCVLFFSILFSAPIGNPTLPSLLQEGFVVPDKCWSNPQCGFIGDYLVQKRFRSCHSNRSLDLRKACLSGTSEIATAAWSVRERLNIQLNLGSGQFSWRWQQGGRNIRGKARGGLLWGGDAKLIILGIRETSLAVDAQAGGWDWMNGSSTINGKAGADGVKSLLRYWQMGVAFTQKISLFSPYLGIAVNRTRFKVSQLTLGTGRMHARHNIGPFGGCSICDTSRLLLNMEWRGWFEEGIALTAQLRF
jgi:hypothetical protein